MTDPIDQLRRRNPVDLEDGPSAPMALAERIMGGNERPARAPGFLVATAFAVSVIAVGAVWLLWLGDGQDTTVAADPTTTTIVDPTTSAALPSTTLPVADTTTTSIGVLVTTQTQVEALMRSIEVIDDVLIVNRSWEGRQISYEDARTAFAASHADAEAVTADGEVGALVARIADTIDAVGTALAEPDDGTLRRNAITYLEGLRSAAAQRAFDLGADIEAPRPFDVAATVYFYLDALAGAYPEHPTLVPVERQLPVGIGEPVETALTALFAGVGAEESASIPQMSTALPSGISILGIDLRPGFLSIDLTGVTADQLTQEALAQIVFTATRVEDVLVAIAVDGTPVVEDALGREPFEGLLPAIMIDSPAVDQQVGNPMRATGTANVFEASVSYAVTDWDGEIIAEGFTMATCGTGCRGDFTVDIAYEVDRVQPGSLIMWESSALDGSQVNVREHRVTLVPATPGSSTDCSTANERWVMEPQDGLPDAVNAARSAIFSIAVTCDFETLAELTSDAGFVYSFGGGDDPAGFFAEQEARGTPLMRLLVQTLNLPSGIIENPDGPNIYAWPEAFVLDIDAWTAAQREALAEIYGADALAGWEDFGGFIGWRVGITETGEWQFFVAGD